MVRQSNCMFSEIGDLGDVQLSICDTNDECCRTNNLKQSDGLKVILAIGHICWPENSNVMTRTQFVSAKCAIRGETKKTYQLSKVMRSNKTDTFDPSVFGSCR